jgi:hypothetical protein
MSATISRITTFADLLQANSYVGRTTSNTFAPINSILTVTGVRGAATFVNITSTLSSAGYSGGDVTGLSTGLSTVVGNQYELILALYQVTSTSFSTLFAELSTTSTVITVDQYSTLSNSYIATANKMPVGAGAIYAGQTLSDTPLQFTSSFANGWNWFPQGNGSGQISSIYVSTPGIYEVNTTVSYNTAATDGGLLLQLRRADGTVLGETISQLPAATSATTSNSIRFDTLQGLAAGNSIYLQLSTLNVPAAAVQTLSGNVGIKLIYNSNNPL